WYDALANLADNTRRVRVFERRRKTDTVKPHADATLQEVRLAFSPVETCNTGWGRFGHQSLIKFCSFNAFSRISLQVAVRINRLLAIAKQEAGIDRRIGILHAASHKTIGFGRWVGESFGSNDQLFKGLWIFDALGREQIFVPVDDPVIDRERQRAEAAI